jgi:hypothetical protein
MRNVCGLALILAAVQAVAHAAPPALTEAGIPISEQLRARINFRHVLDMGPIFRTATGELSEHQNPPEVQFTLELDTPANPVGVRETGFLSSLGYSVQFYALWTGDYDVTIQDIWDAGLMPYAVEDSLDYQRGLKNSTAFDKWALYRIGSASWLAMARASILQQWIGDIDPGLHEADLIRNPAFWVNPYTGAEMAPGPLPGDLFFNEVTIGEDGGISSRYAEKPGPNTIPIIHTPRMQDYYKADHERLRAGYTVITDPSVTVTFGPGAE